MADQQGKTEKPTPRRLRRARKEGQFARTPDAATWVAIAAGAALLPRSATVLTDEVRARLRRLPEVIDDPSLPRVLRALAGVPQDVLLAAAPVCLAALGGALLATAAQGVHLTGKTLRPRFSRMSPVQGLKRMFGVRAAWEAVKALLKVAVVAVVVVVLGSTLLPELLGGPMPLGVTLQRAYQGLQTLIWSAALAGLALALADYAYQRRTLMKQLRMSPREIRDEVKQTEGDPLIRSAIRSRQLAISRNRMLSAVASADVVLVNPTHYAVALKYEPIRGAPRVIAKGAGSLALKIRERAREHDVPLVEDKLLTRTLYRVCELGDEIPAELYLAVARILAFVMAARRPGGRAGSPVPRPEPGPLPPLPSKSALRARRARETRQARRGWRPPSGS